MEEQNNDFRALVLRAFVKTKFQDIREQINGYKSLIKIAKEKNWIV